MKSLISLISRTPKQLRLFSAIFATAIIASTSLFAWGPSRQTFTTAQPADYITFNSITDNPAQGDERNFMQVRASDASNSTYADSIALTAGKQYTVFMYYHNNAASNLNLVAEGTYAKAQIPAIVASGGAGTKAVGYVGASNATPREVWDDITFTNATGGDIALRMVPGSAKINNFGATNGATLSDNIVTTGATLGYNALDGRVPGCNQYAGYVTFNLVADQANFSVEKLVRLSGTSTWSKSVTAKVNDTVEYQIQYKNTGTTAQNNVVLKDTLPTSITYVTGSSYLKNATYPNANKVSDNIVASSGINIGNYTSGSNAYVKFSSKVTDKNLVCGTNTLVNKVVVETANGSKSDTANVVVTKTCPTTPKQLPKTGPTETIISMLGLGTLVASARYYVASRRTI